MLKRLRVKEPWGPDNFYWTVPIPDAKGANETKEKKATYMRAWRRQNLHHSRNLEMRRRYGIDLAEYDRILAQQSEACAICETKVDYFRLSIDHCHGTGKVRGILCAKCNRGLGGFNDQPELLEKAARYLRKSREP